VARIDSVALLAGPHKSHSENFVQFELSNTSRSQGLKGLHLRWHVAMGMVPFLACTFGHSRLLELYGSQGVRCL
jgi:hypothetical protein